MVMDSINLLGYPADVPAPVVCLCFQLTCGGCRAKIIERNTPAMLYAAAAQRDVPRADPVPKGCATCGTSLAGHLAWCSKCVEIAPGWKVVPDDASQESR